MKDKHAAFLKEAIRLSIDNVKSNHGGPFGAVVVLDNKIIATGANEVISSNDPTAHAEIVAIRNAAKALNTFDLSNCVIYSSCEPCPMCLSAIYWAKISTVYFANTKEDAANSQFNDSFIYDEIAKSKENRTIQMKHITHEDAIKAFDLWDNMEGKIAY